MSLAGFTQVPLTGARLTLEDLLTAPPKALIISNYRSTEYSRGQAWLDHPLVRKSSVRKVATDGRPWTCLGPAMIPEVERLRRLTR